MIYRIALSFALAASFAHAAPQTPECDQAARERVLNKIFRIPGIPGQGAAVAV